MAYLDRAARRLDLKLIYWGPGRGGKTTSLRSLHGAFAPADRGEIQSVETADERTYFFDYAPLDLPRYGDYAVRVHAYTVPGQDIYVETRRRILRGADGVDLRRRRDVRPRRLGNQSSWRQLDEALDGDRAAAGTRSRSSWRSTRSISPTRCARPRRWRRSRSVVPDRAPIDVVETTAIRGTRGRALLPHAARRRRRARALVGARRAAPAPRAQRFLDELDRHVQGTDDGASVGAHRCRRARCVVATLPRHAARRRRARGRARGQPPARAARSGRPRSPSPAGARPPPDRRRPALPRGLERHLARELGPDGARLEPRGVDGAGSACPTRPAARTSSTHSGPTRPTATPSTGSRDGVGAGVDGGATVAVEVPAADAGLPRRRGEGRRGVLAPFATGDGRTGLDPAARAAATAASPPAPTTCSRPRARASASRSSRLDALACLQDSNSILERRVEERTQDLRQERDSLERRVRERTLELEAAKHSTVEAERRLLDLERTEGVKRLAAGLAHELNNPLGAAPANLDFARETILAAARRARRRTRAPTPRRPSTRSPTRAGRSARSRRTSRRCSTAPPRRGAPRSRRLVAHRRARRDRRAREGAPGFGGADARRDGTSSPAASRRPSARAGSSACSASSRATAAPRSASRSTGPTTARASRSSARRPPDRSCRPTSTRSSLEIERARRRAAPELERRTPRRCASCCRAPSARRGPPRGRRCDEPPPRAGSCAIRAT